MREKKSGSLYQRCEKRLGCPALVAGPDGKKVRPKHRCKGAWVASVELPEINGVRQRKVVVRAKKADIVPELKRLREAYAKNPNMGTTTPTVARWCEIWWKDFGKNRLKPGGSQKSYQSCIKNHIVPCLGKVKLDRLTTEHVEQLRRFIVEEQGLSSTTALGTHRVFSVILRDAMRRRLITENPCTLTDAPRKRRYEMKEGRDYLASADARTLLAAHDPGDGTVPIALARWSTALLAGPRQGEVLGMTREYLDFNNETITFSWQLQRISYEHGCGEQLPDKTWPCKRRKGGYCPKRHVDLPEAHEIKHVTGGLYLMRPKSEASWRTVPMVGPLAAVLREYTRTHSPGLHELVLARQDGRPLDPSQDSADWKTALERAGLARVKGHSARHTCNTILTELQIPVDVRQQILGHGSRAVIELTYTHTSDARVADAMRQLGAAVDWRS
jgi:integrase